MKQKLRWRWKSDLTLTFNVRSFWVIRLRFWRNLKNWWEWTKYINLSSRNDNKLRLLYIKCVKCFHILTIFIFECLSLVKCFLQRRKCRRIPFSESVICSVSNEIYLHHLANNDVFVLKYFQIRTLMIDLAVCKSFSDLFVTEGLEVWSLTMK